MIVVPRASSETAMAGETVLVTDAGLGSAVAVIRSLGRAGFRVIAGSAELLSAGAVSRYVAERLRYPSPEEDSDAFVEHLVEAVDRRSIDLILPVTDNALLPLARVRDRFEDKCVLGIASDAALRAAIDKERTMQDAEALGIPVPRGMMVRTIEEAHEAAAQLGWPVVLKPRSSRYSDNGRMSKLEVSYARDHQDLERRMVSLCERCDVLVQAWCPGQGVGVELLMHDGEVLAEFQHVREREFPVHGGPGALRRAVPVDPELRRYSVELLRSWGWSGLAMVEFKRSEQSAWLMEVNGRIWGSLPLAVHAGVDFPRLYVELLLGRSSRTTPPACQLGVRSRNLGLDLTWILAVLLGLPHRRYPFLPAPRRTAALVAAAQLFHPSIHCDVQSIRDPLPGLVDLLAFIRKLAGKFGNSLSGGRF